MSQTWNSLYCHCDSPETVAQALRDAVEANGYTLYNPFSLIPGKAYAQTVRLFVAPAVSRWVRIIGETPDWVLAALSGVGVCLLLALDEGSAAIQVFTDGQPNEPKSTLLPFLRPECTADDLRKILSGDVGTRCIVSLQPRTVVIPLDALPDDLQTLAGQVNPAQAQKMFSRLTGQVMKKVGGGEEADAARALVVGAGEVDWNGAGGQQIQSLMACLTMPENWRAPDFIRLRDAYQLHERRRRLPNARLYPGDAETMSRVPDALDYTAVYGGRT